MTAMQGEAPRSGRVAAALVAAGVGAFLLGLVVVLAEASEGFAGLLSFYPPTGSLSGKVSLTVVGWLAAWGGLHLRWSGKEVALGRPIVAMWILLALGLLGTFPPFFYLFG